MEQKAERCVSPKSQCHLVTWVIENHRNPSTTAHAFHRRELKSRRLTVEPEIAIEVKMSRRLPKFFGFGFSVLRRDAVLERIERNSSLSVLVMGPKDGKRWRVTFRCFAEVKCAAIVPVKRHVVRTNFSDLSKFRDGYIYRVLLPHRWQPYSAICGQLVGGLGKRDVLYSCHGPSAVYCERHHFRWRRVSPDTYVERDTGVIERAA